MIEQIWTGGPLTDLINNAAGNFVSRTQDLSPRGFDAIANIVMHGTFYVTHAIGRRWIAEKQRGNVVSITVTWVRNGCPYVVPSAMSKSAIHAMTMSLAMEWGRYGIRLNTIAPGEIPTEGMSKRLNPNDEPGARTIARNPMGRVGKMEELQNLAVFLISGGCDWINGETIAMDGAQALATGGNFYETARMVRCRLAARARLDHGAERKGPRVAGLASSRRRQGPITTVVAARQLCVIDGRCMVCVRRDDGVSFSLPDTQTPRNENKTPREKHVRHTSAGKPCRDGARARQEPRRRAGL